MNVIKLGDPVPRGPFEVGVSADQPVAGVYHHPRLEGHWLAVVPPRDWHSSGLKRFKTHAGAARYVMRNLQNESRDDRR